MQAQDGARTLVKCERGLYYNLSDSTAEVTYDPDCYKDLGDVVIPSIVFYNGIDHKVTSIGNNTFSHIKLVTPRFPSSYYENCPCSITSIIISEGVTSIGDYAFNNCGNLTSIAIPSSVTNIGKELISYCMVLTYETKNEKRWSALSCRNFTSINVKSENANYSSEDGVLFNKDKTTLILCPSGKTGDYVIPSSVTRIAEKAFQYCDNLTSITIPEDLTPLRHFSA